MFQDGTTCSQTKCIPLGGSSAARQEKALTLNFAERNRGTGSNEGHCCCKAAKNTLKVTVAKAQSVEQRVTDS